LELAGRGVPVRYGARPAAGGVPSGRRLLRTSDVSLRGRRDIGPNEIPLQTVNEISTLTTNRAWMGAAAEVSEYLKASVTPLPMGCLGGQKYWPWISGAASIAAARASAAWPRTATRGSVPPIHEAVTEVGFGGRGPPSTIGASDSPTPIARPIPSMRTASKRYGVRRIRPTTKCYAHSLQFRSAVVPAARRWLPVISRRA